MSKLIDIDVHDDVWRLLKLVPADERARVVDQALREWARRRRRLDAVAEMDRLRSDGEAKPTTSDEIVRWIREERDIEH